MMKHVLSYLGAIAAAFLLSTNVALGSSITRVDTLPSAPKVTVTSNGPATTNETTVVQTGDPSNILGGERELTLELIDTRTSDSPLAPEVEIKQAGGLAAISSDVQADPKLTFLWNGPGQDGLSGQDFFTNPGEQFAFTVYATDQPLSISMMIDDQWSAEQLVNPGTGPADLTFSSSSFGGASFTGVEKVALSIDGPAGSDFSFGPITFFTVVPEPSTLALSGISLLGVLGLGMARRSRRR